MFILVPLPDADDAWKAPIGEPETGADLPVLLPRHEQQAAVDDAFAAGEISRGEWRERTDAIGRLTADGKVLCHS